MLSEKCFGKNENKCEKNEIENLQLLYYCIYGPKYYTGGALSLVDLKTVSRVNEYIISVEI